MKATTHLNAAGRRKRVFLVDQFPITRMAVSEWLGQTSEISVCGEADNAITALAAVRNLRPDLVVTEIFNQQDLGFIQSLRRRCPELPILVFSFRDEEWYAPRALEAGADGYLTKCAGRQALLDGIRGAIEGRIVLSPEMRARLLIKCRTRSRAFTSIWKPYDRLCSMKGSRRLRARKNRGLIPRSLSEKARKRKR